MNLPRQFIVFCFVGVISVAVDLVTLLELVQLEVPPLIAVTISFIAGMLINIWLHANLTFKTTLNTDRVVRFLMILCINYLVTLAAVLFFEKQGFSYFLGKLISLPLIAIHGFLWSRLWIFKV
jgi:putative flippase GtrA